jgi:hypothetical protein
MRISGLEPAKLWRWLLMAGFVFIAAANLPGQLSTDSIIALSEGRSGVRASWGPPMYSAIVGFFDAIVPGTGLYVAVSLLILLGSWAAMATVRGKVSWIAPILLAVVLLLPQVLIYQGIVWKDVLFANLSIAAFVSLAMVAKRWGSKSAYWLIGLAWVCLAFACLVRQNGVVAVLFGGLALGWTAWPQGWKRAGAWGAAGLVGPLVLAGLLNAATPVKEAEGTIDQDRGVRMVQQYDLAGALAQSPQKPLPILEAEKPESLAVLRKEAAIAYSPERIDFMGRSEAIGPAFWSFSDEAIGDQWKQLILTEPLGYAGRRFEVFRWVFMTPVIDRCLPLHVGVAGPDAMVAQLNLATGIEPQDQSLYNYATWWFDTPVYSHVAYAVLALVAAGFLLIRRSPGDVAVAGLALAGLSFAASFFVISLACDYRYIYFLDISAITAALYIALDPRLGGARKA